MRKNTSSKLVLALCLLAFCSCRAKKQLVVSHKPDSTATATATAALTIVPPVVAAPAAKSPDEIFRETKLNDIRSGQVDFTTFSGKAQAKLNINGDKNDVSMNIRIKKNKQIWISITAILGVEVARAVITPDSIKVMNKLEGTYLKKPFSYVYAYTSRQINYRTLESIIIGNAIPELLSDSTTVKPDNSDNLILSGFLKELGYRLTVNSGLKVSQTSMTSASAGQALTVNDNAFIKTGNHVIPSQISINSSAKQNIIQADLRYTRADFDTPVDMPFSVPARYSVVK